jgi:hypothetical protein
MVMEPEPPQKQYNWNRLYHTLKRDKYVVRVLQVETWLQKVRLWLKYKWINLKITLFMIKSKIKH